MNDNDGDILSWKLVDKCFYNTRFFANGMQKCACP